MQYLKHNLRILNLYPQMVYQDPAISLILITEGLDMDESFHVMSDIHDTRNFINGLGMTRAEIEGLC